MLQNRILIITSVLGMAVTVAGCGASPIVSQTPTASSKPSTKPSTAPTTGATESPPVSTSSAASVTTTANAANPYSTAAPVVMSMPGALETNVAWPVKGSTVSHTGSPMFTEQFTRHGAIIDGVKWRWPSSDTNPQHYMVVPTVVGGTPYLVWAHLGAYTGSRGVSYDPHQPATLWMTRWTSSGGSLSTHATLITNDVPPLWSRTGQWTFAANGSTQSMAESAWTSWFHWGKATAPYVPAPGKPGATPTMAWPDTLYPAQNGVILVVQTHLLGYAQGAAFNVYDLNLQQRTITGLASISNGGGIFDGLSVWNGLVLDAEAKLEASGSITSTVVAYNEITGQRQQIPWGQSLPIFYNYELVGHRLLNGQGKRVATIAASKSVLYGPNPNPF